MATVHTEILAANRAPAQHPLRLFIKKILPDGTQQTYHAALDATREPELQCGCHLECNPVFHPGHSYCGVEVGTALVGTRCEVSFNVTTCHFPSRVSKIFSAAFS